MNAETTGNRPRFIYLGVKKGTAAHRKEEEALKKASAKKKTAKANAATEKLKAARKAMNLDR